VRTLELREWEPRDLDGETLSPADRRLVQELEGGEEAFGWMSFEAGYE
jgi:hypothetical protein